MTIAIIGGGFTSLAAAYDLSRQGHTVTILEQQSVLGGLASGFRRPSWDWHLEYSYHHLFTSDKAIHQLFRDMDHSHLLQRHRPQTVTQYKQQLYPIDSPLSLLKFPGITLSDKIRTAAVIAASKLPYLPFYEHFTAEQIYRTLGGESSWDSIWKPLLIGKFGTYASEIAASWLWARIHARTSSLVYPEGGFNSLIAIIEQELKKHSVDIQLNTTVTSIKKTVKGVSVQTANKNFMVDSVLLTCPTTIAQRLLPQKYHQLLKPSLYIPHLWAQVLILESDQPLHPDYYWINITDRQYPFLAVVNHTAMISPEHYGGKYITYIGNYLPMHHPFIKRSASSLYRIFSPFLKQLNPKWTFKPSTSNMFLFTAPYAQPVHIRGYTNLRPPAKIDSGIYLSNMDSIFPWDRGTNYAVEAGRNIAHRISTEA